MGKTAPNPSEAITLEDGVVVPLGKPVDHSSTMVYFNKLRKTSVPKKVKFINCFLSFFFCAGDVIVQRIYYLQYGKNEDAIRDPSQIQLHVVNTH